MTLLPCKKHTHNFINGVASFFLFTLCRREQALKTLQAEGLFDGLYLVRENTRNPGCYGLSVAYKGEAKHYLIAKTEDAQYAIEGGKSYGNLPDLLEHYQKQKVRLIILLFMIIKVRSVV